MLFQSKRVSCYCSLLRSKEQSAPVVLEKFQRRRGILTLFTVAVTVSFSWINEEGKTSRSFRGCTAWLNIDGTGDGIIAFQLNALSVDGLRAWSVYVFVCSVTVNDRFKLHSGAIEKFWPRKISRLQSCTENLYSTNIP